MVIDRIKMTVEWCSIKLTLMSADLFQSLHNATDFANKVLKVQSCNMKVQLYASANTVLSSVALVQISMTLVHPVHISDLKSDPLLIGNAFLYRLMPFISFQNLKM